MLGGRDPLEEMLGGLSPTPPREGARQRILGPARRHLGRAETRPPPSPLLLQLAALAACFLLSLGVDAWLGRRLDRVLPVSQRRPPWVEAVSLGGVVDEEEVVLLVKRRRLVPRRADSWGWSL